MQEIQLLLVQAQTVVAQLAFQVLATLGLALAWLVVALGQQPCAAAWRGMLALTVRAAVALGLLWLVVLAVAWPPLLERTGNVLGPIVAGLVTMMLVADALSRTLSQTKRSALQILAAVCVAMGFSLAIILVVLALGWMDEPVGAVLIDGRYQVTQWSEALGNRRFLDGLLASVFGACLLGSALVQWVRQSGPVTVLAVPEAWQRGLAGLGVVGLLGLLWLLSRAVGMQLNPVSQTAQTLYEALLTGSGNGAGSGNGVLRATFVLWLITLAGLVASLGVSASSRARAQAPSRLGMVAWRFVMVAAPVLWALVCWQLFAAPLQSQVADLPVDDLISMQPAPLLAFGLVLVAAVVVVAFWIFWRFVNRLGELTDTLESGQARSATEARTVT